MIPKIIHWCWLNDEPFCEEIKYCRESWTKLEGYTFMKWDLNNFDQYSVPFVKYMCDNKLYAFASDFVRFWACYTYGGIYLDTDIEVLRTFDELLSRDYILGEMNGAITAAVVGCAQGHPLFRDFMNYFKDMDLSNWNGYSIQNVLYELCKEENLDFLNYKLFDPCIGPNKYDLSPNTFTIHHYQFSWHAPLLEYQKSHKTHI